MNKKYKQSLYITLGIIIISTVTVIMAVQASYSYISTKNKIIEEMKQSSKLTINSLKKNVTNLMASYAINEYENLIQNEMEHQSHFSIVLEDYNMGKILGKKSFVSGKIRDADWNIINFDSENTEQVKQLEACFYSDEDIIITPLGQKVGNITIYISDNILNRELNKIISGTVINAIAISLILIFSLLITIRFFILKPVSNIISAINDSDEDGIPVELIPVQGAAEIFALSKTMNTMIHAIRDSRIRVTEQRDVLKVQDDKLRTLSMATEQSPTSILIFSAGNIIEYVNPQFEITSGYSAKDVIDKPIEDLFKESRFDISLVAAINQTLAAGKRWIGEVAAVTKRGENYFMRLSVSPILLEDGSVTHNICVAEDMTEHKKNEDILRNSQKMDAVGQLTGGIAHDFNNLLGIIMGNLELLQLTLKDNPKALERIDSALAGATRGAQLTRKLLNFSRQDHKKQQLTQINLFVENLRELIAKSVTASIQVEIHLEEHLWPVEIDSGDLEDAILNLSLNARDAMPNGGVLVIETANKQVDGNFVNENPGSREGDFVVISVSDSGTGISEGVRKKIFDPFFSTKEFGKGSGLGLSMVYGFVQRSGGNIQISSEEGNGTAFHIYLPRAIDGQIEQIDDEKQVELPRGSETILVVDDEKGLATSTEKYLQQLGYKTLAAYSGKEALEIFSTTEGIDLIFSDVVMPEMDGFELAFTAAEQQSSIKILLTSGFTSKHMELRSEYKEAHRKFAKQLLSKPYNLRELAIAVRRILDE